MGPVTAMIPDHTRGAAMKTTLLLSMLAALIQFVAPAGASPAPSTFGPSYAYPPACDTCRPFWQVAPPPSRGTVTVRTRVHHQKRGAASADTDR
jgi:hypothetical protein